MLNDYSERKMKTHYVHKYQGFTLVEMVVVLVVISAIAIVAYPRITDSYNKKQQTEITQDIQMLYTGANQFRGQRPVFTGVSCNALVTDEYITVSWANCTGVNPVDGNYVVSANSADPNNVDIQVTGLDGPMCNRLARTLSTQAEASACSGGTLTVTFDA